MQLLNRQFLKKNKEKPYEYLSMLSLLQEEVRTNSIYSWEPIFIIADPNNRNLLNMLILKNWRNRDEKSSQNTV